MPKSIAILGEYSPDFEPHRCTDAALTHSARQLNIELASRWIATDTIDDKLFDEFDAIWIAPGSPYKNMEKTLKAIQHARENDVPCFGTCGGFQHIVIEYARNVLEFRNAQHAEYDRSASELFVTELACSLAGREMNIRLTPDSRIAAIYQQEIVQEQYYCNFGINPSYATRFADGPLRIVGTDTEGEIRILELPNHPFFIGTLFVPQSQSTTDQPHPLITAFVQATLATKT